MNENGISSHQSESFLPHGSLNHMHRLHWFVVYNLLSYIIYSFKHNILGHVPNNAR